MVPYVQKCILATVTVSLKSASHFFLCSFIEKCTINNLAFKTIEII